MEKTETVKEKKAFYKHWQISLLIPLHIAYTSQFHQHSISIQCHVHWESQTIHTYIQKLLGIANTSTTNPESCPSTPSSSNSYFLVNVKPDEKWILILIARLSFIFSLNTDIKGIQWSNFYPKLLKYESKNPILPWKPPFKCQESKRPQENTIFDPLCLKFCSNMLFLLWLKEESIYTLLKLEFFI